MGSADGFRGRLDDVVPDLYGQLNRLARRAMAGQRPNHTLEPTALVHEAYIRLAAARNLELREKPTFLSLAARVMRQVLVDHARAKRSDKRGGDALRVTLSEGLPERDRPTYEILTLDEALTRLEAIDPRQVKIVELRYLAGLSVEEVAKLLEISSATVKRESSMARAWLFAEVSSDSR